MQPDIIHLHNLHSNYINYNRLFQYLSNRDIATVITLHDCWFYTGKCFHYSQVGCMRWMEGCGQCPKLKSDTPSFFGDYTSQVCKERTDGINSIRNVTIVGVSDWICNEARKSLIKDKPIFRIYNSVDTLLFSPTRSNLREKYKIGESDFVMMGLTKKFLLPSNIKVFEAITNLLNSQTKLVLVGGDSNDNKKMSSNPNIVVINYVDSPSIMAQLYSMADIFVNVTREESLSLVNVECQACGTPVLTYSACGASETVPESFRVNIDDVDSMINKITNIRELGKSNYSSECIDWIKKRFTDTYENYIELYKLMLSK